MKDSVRGGPTSARGQRPADGSLSARQRQQQEPTQPIAFGSRAPPSTKPAAAPSAAPAAGRRPKRPLGPEPIPPGGRRQILRSSGDRTSSAGKPSPSQGSTTTQDHAASSQSSCDELIKAQQGSAGRRHHHVVRTSSDQTQQQQRKAVPALSSKLGSAVPSLDLSKLNAKPAADSSAPSRAVPKLALDKLAKPGDESEDETAQGGRKEKGLQVAPATRASSRRRSSSGRLLSARQGQSSARADSRRVSSCSNRGSVTERSARPSSRRQTMTITGPAAAGSKTARVHGSPPMTTRDRFGNSLLPGDIDQPAARLQGTCMTTWANSPREKSALSTRRRTPQKSSLTPREKSGVHRSPISRINTDWVNYGRGSPRGDMDPPNSAREYLAATAKQGGASTRYAAEESAEVTSSVEDDSDDIMSSQDQAHVPSSAAAPPAEQMAESLTGDAGLAQRNARPQTGTQEPAIPSFLKRTVPSLSPLGASTSFDATPQSLNLSSTPAFPPHSDLSPPPQEPPEHQRNMSASTNRKQSPSEPQSTGSRGSASARSLRRPAEWPDMPIDAVIRDLLDDDVLVGTSGTFGGAAASREGSPEVQSALAVQEPEGAVQQPSVQPALGQALQSPAVQVQQLEVEDLQVIQAEFPSPKRQRFSPGPTSRTDDDSPLSVPDSALQLADSASPAAPSSPASAQPQAASAQLAFGSFANWAADQPPGGAAQPPQQGDNSAGDGSEQEDVYSPPMGERGSHRSAVETPFYSPASPAFSFGSMPSPPFNSAGIRQPFAFSAELAESGAESSADSMGSRQQLGHFNWLDNTTDDRLVAADQLHAAEPADQSAEPVHDSAEPVHDSAEYANDSTADAADLTGPGAESSLPPADSALPENESAAPQSVTHADRSGALHTAVHEPDVTPDESSLTTDDSAEPQPNAVLPFGNASATPQHESATDESAAPEHDSGMPAGQPEEPEAAPSEAAPSEAASSEAASAEGYMLEQDEAALRAMAAAQELADTDPDNWPSHSQAEFEAALAGLTRLVEETEGYGASDAESSGQQQADGILAAHDEAAITAPAPVMAAVDTAQAQQLQAAAFAPGAASSLLGFGSIIQHPSLNFSAYMDQSPDTPTLASQAAAASAPPAAAASDQPVPTASLQSAAADMHESVPALSDFSLDKVPAEDLEDAAESKGSFSAAASPSFPGAAMLPASPLAGAWNFVASNQLFSMEEPAEAAPTPVLPHAVSVPETPVQMLPRGLQSPEATLLNLQPALEQPALTPVQQSVADTAVHNPADSVTPSAAAAETEQSLEQHYNLSVPGGAAASASSTASRPASHRTPEGFGSPVEEQFQTLQALPQRRSLSQTPRSSISSLPVSPTIRHSLCDMGSELHEAAGSGDFADQFLAGAESAEERSLGDESAGRESAGSGGESDAGVSHPAEGLGESAVTPKDESPVTDLEDVGDDSAEAAAAAVSAWADSAAQEAAQPASIVPDGMPTSVAGFDTSVLFDDEDEEDDDADSYSGQQASYNSPMFNADPSASASQQISKHSSHADSASPLGQPSASFKSASDSRTAVQHVQQLTGLPSDSDMTPVSQQQLQQGLAEAAGIHSTPHKPLPISYHTDMMLYLAHEFGEDWVEYHMPVFTQYTWDQLILQEATHRVFVKPGATAYSSAEPYNEGGDWALAPQDAATPGASNRLTDSAESVTANSAHLIPASNRAQLTAGEDLKERLFAASLAEQSADYNPLSGLSPVAQMVPESAAHAAELVPGVAESAPATQHAMSDDSAATPQPEVIEKTAPEDDSVCTQLVDESAAAAEAEGNVESALPAADQHAAAEPAPTAEEAAAEAHQDLTPGNQLQAKLEDVPDVDEPAAAAQLLPSQGDESASLAEAETQPQASVAEEPAAEAAHPPASEQGGGQQAAVKAHMQTVLAELQATMSGDGQLPSTPVPASPSPHMATPPAKASATCTQPRALQLDSIAELPEEAAGRSEAATSPVAEVMSSPGEVSVSGPPAAASPGFTLLAPSRTFATPATPSFFSAASHLAGTPLASEATPISRQLSDRLPSPEAEHAAAQPPLQQLQKEAHAAAEPESPADTEILLAAEHEQLTEATPQLAAAGTNEAEDVQLSGSADESELAEASLPAAPEQQLSALEPEEDASPASVSPADEHAAAGLLQPASSPSAASADNPVADQDIAPAETAQQERPGDPVQLPEAALPLAHAAQSELSQGSPQADKHQAAEPATTEQPPADARAETAQAVQQWLQTCAEQTGDDASAYMEHDSVVVFSAESAQQAAAHLIIQPGALQRTVAESKQPVDGSMQELNESAAVIAAAAEAESPLMQALTPSPMSQQLIVPLSQVSAWSEQHSDFDLTPGPVQISQALAAAGAAAEAASLSSQTSAEEAVRSFSSATVEQEAAVPEAAASFTPPEATPQLSKTAPPRPAVTEEAAVEQGEAATSFVSLAQAAIPAAAGSSGQPPAASPGFAGFDLAAYGLQPAFEKLTPTFVGSFEQAIQSGSPQGAAYAALVQQATAETPGSEARTEQVAAASHPSPILQAYAQLLPTPPLFLNPAASRAAAPVPAAATLAQAEERAPAGGPPPALPPAAPEGPFSTPEPPQHPPLAHIPVATPVQPAVGSGPVTDSQALCPPALQQANIAWGLPALSQADNQPQVLAQLLASITQGLYDSPGLNPSETSATGQGQASFATPVRELMAAGPHGSNRAPMRRPALHLTGSRATRQPSRLAQGSYAAAALPSSPASADSAADEPEELSSASDEDAAAPHELAEASQADQAAAEELPSPPAARPETLVDDFDLKEASPAWAREETPFFTPQGLGTPGSLEGTPIRRFTPADPFWSLSNSPAVAADSLAAGGGSPAAATSSPAAAAESPVPHGGIATPASEPSAAAAQSPARAALAAASPARLAAAAGLQSHALDWADMSPASSSFPFSPAGSSMSPELTSGLLALADRLQLIRRGMLEVVAEGNEPASPSGSTARRLLHQEGSVASPLGQTPPHDDSAYEGADSLSRPTARNLEADIAAETVQLGQHDQQGLREGIELTSKAAVTDEAEPDVATGEHESSYSLHESAQEGAESEQQEAESALQHAQPVTEEADSPPAQHDSPPAGSTPHFHSHDVAVQTDFEDEPEAEGAEQALAGHELSDLESEDSVSEALSDEHSNFVDAHSLHNSTSGSFVVVSESDDEAAGTVQAPVLRAEPAPASAASAVPRLALNALSQQPPSSTRLPADPSLPAHPGADSSPAEATPQRIPAIHRLQAASGQLQAPSSAPPVPSASRLAPQGEAYPENADANRGGSTARGSLTARLTGLSKEWLPLGPALGPPTSRVADASTAERWHSRRIASIMGYKSARERRA